MEVIVHGEACRYWLDGDHLITAVSGPWDRFAVENGGVSASADRVRGRSIWDFVDGDPTRMWLDAILQLAAVTRRPVQRRCRCDSPEVARRMLMTVTPEADDALRVTHQLLHATPLSEPVLIRHCSEGPLEWSRDRCSVCGRVRDRDAVWRDPADCAAAAGSELVVRYTVCAACESAR